MNFSAYIYAGYPVLWVKSFEETRVLNEYIHDVQTNKPRREREPKGRKTFVWDVVDGIREATFNDTGNLVYGEKINFKDPRTNEESPTNEAPGLPLKWLDEQAPENCILFLKDYTPYLEDKYQGSTDLKRKIRNMIDNTPRPPLDIGGGQKRPIGAINTKGRHLVLLSSKVAIPEELSKEMTVIEHVLPTKDELKTVLRAVCQNAGATYPATDKEEALIDAACGLTTFEAENAFSLSRLDPAIVRKEKSAVVKKTGILEIIENNASLADIGGLEKVKTWLTSRGKCFRPHARGRKIKPPKGMLLVGIPGTGKSLVAKTVANIWGRPLLKLDMSKVADKWYGGSEGNMRQVIDLAEACAPCVLWMDEVEKGLAGADPSKSAGGSHEVTQKVLGQLLTWMSDKTADVFIVATANSIQSLPDALLRAGRIDVKFWVDLPDDVQREEIIKIHLRKVDIDAASVPMPDLIRLSDGYSGAEIEVWIQEALVASEDADRETLTLADFQVAVDAITPVGKQMDLAAARTWAAAHGIKPASATHQRAAAAPEVAVRRVSNN